MKVKEIVVKKEVKLSINYNTVSSSVILTAELDENEDETLVHEILSRKAREMVMKDITTEVSLIEGV